MPRIYEKFVAHAHDRLTKRFSDPTPKIIAAMDPAPVTALEIGVAQGEGAKLIIKAMLKRVEFVDYYGVDLFDEHTPAEISDKLSWKKTNVTLLVGDSKQVLKNRTLPPMDFISIDGGHDYETVKADWENCQKLIGPNTTIVFDDYKRCPGVTRAVNEIDQMKYELTPMKVKHISLKYPFVTTYIGKCVVNVRA